MSRTRERKGPAGHRFIVMILNIVLAILVYWLLGFIIDDIGNQPGPSLTDIQKQFQDQTLVKQKEALNNQYEKLSRNIEAQRQQQALLQTSINSYRDTMNQLLDLQKASVQKGVTFSSESQQNLANVTKLYLDNQQKFQDLNRSIAQANATAQQLQNQTSGIDVQLTKQSEQAYQSYDNLLMKHNFVVAGFQLLVLIPLLIIAVYFFKKYRQTIYSPILTAIGIAIILKIIMVMHEHFPSRAFKYILILALIYIILRALVSMLRMVIAPKASWLLKQYREAYQKLECAMCQYPIQPGLLKFFKSRSNKKDIGLTDISYIENTEAYICPSCGERLFEKCDVCAHTRHSLLMFCDHCGAEKKTV